MECGEETNDTVSNNERRGPQCTVATLIHGRGDIRVEPRGAK